MSLGRYCEPVWTDGVPSCPQSEDGEPRDWCNGCALGAERLNEMGFHLVTSFLDDWED